MKVFYVKQFTRRGRRKFVLSAESFFHAVHWILKHYQGTVVLHVEDITASTTPSEFITEDDVFQPRFSQILTVFVGLLIAAFFSYHSSINIVPVGGRVVLACLALYGVLMAVINGWRLFKELRSDKWASEAYFPDQITLVEGQSTAAIERFSESEYAAFVRGTVQLGSITLDSERTWTVTWITGESVHYRSFDQALLDVCQRLCGHLCGH
jgi:hypothetical protein